MNKNHYVYKITNLINGKMYIGKRSCECEIEKDTYMGSGDLLIKAQEKYGMDNFKKEILCVCETEQQALNTERQYIKNENACKDRRYYNLAEGGFGGNAILGMSEKQKQAIRQKMSKSITKTFKTKENKCTRKVICTTTGEIFNCMTSAEEKYNLSYSAVYNCCKGYARSAGKHPETGKRLVWMYLEDYEEKVKNNEFILTTYKQIAHNKRKVRCITTNEIFDSLEQASSTYNINHSNISYCCRGEQKTCGKHPETGERLRWEYYME